MIACRTSVSKSFLAVAVVLGGACGSEGTDEEADGGASASDAASQDARVDAARLVDASIDGGGLDAGSSRAYRVCDPYLPLSCGSDEKCQVVFDPVPGEPADLYFGCVPSSTGAVEVGLPCSNAVPLPDPPGGDAITHSCAGASLCIGTPFLSCRPLCGREALGCERTGELCLFVIESPATAACLPVDTCDAYSQSGCDAGEGCYLRNNAFGDWLTDCVTTQIPPDEGEPLAEGAPCNAFNSCQAGTGCHQAVSEAGVFEGELRCRRYCDASGSPNPCSGGAVCRALPLAAGSQSQTSGEPGVCQFEER